MYRLFLSLLFTGALLLSLSSCSDPTGVGDNLGGGSLNQGSPRSVDAVASNFGTTTIAPQTGFDLSAETASDRSWQFLAGAVKDPVAGVIEAEGYVDFLGTQSRPESIQGAPASQLDAELRLVPSYLHGDTLSTIELNLFELVAETEMHRVAADTSFLLGSQLSPPNQPGGSYSITPVDSVVTLPLPESWIQDNLTALKADSFGTDISGFVLQAATEPTATDRQVVAGFGLRSATLRLSSSTDTVDFQALKSFTHVERRGTPEVDIQGRTLLQDGVGTALTMNWNFEESPLDTLRNTPLNRVDITVPIDSATMAASLAEASESFSRPPANTYRITATRADGAQACRQLGFFEFRSQSETCRLTTDPGFAPGQARVASQTAFSIFERALFDTPPFTTFQVGIAVQQSPSPQNSLRRGLPSTVPALVHTTAADTSALPRAILTVTPL